ncbi:hypothetical protein SAMN05421812_13614 [Asanoa hainanensis]|uniref:ABC transporter n=3 Tax=Asanoa TaxID=195964 RepID=A0A239PGG2_9ACTN|nr:hypothetical protein Asi02nite_37490 [Asanoa siamensis]SNT66267.1 hypothetical protein SAMN05421812_13614 [Asanoa hainanensis]
MLCLSDVSLHVPPLYGLTLRLCRGAREAIICSTDVSAAIVGILQGSVPHVGAVTVAGVTLTGRTRRAAPLALVRREPATVAAGTVAGAVTAWSPLTPGGRDGHEATTRILAACGLRDHATHSVNSLTVGSRRLLDLAIAWTQHPAAIVIDDPAASMTSSEVQHLTYALTQLPQDTAVLSLAPAVADIAAIATHVRAVNDGRPQKPIAVADLPVGTDDPAVLSLTGRGRR